MASTRSRPPAPALPGPGTSTAAAGEPPKVFIVSRDTECGECGKALPRSSWMHLEGEKALCLDCAVLGHLEFLPSGDVALTRRATKHSRTHAVVLRWSTARKQYERQGTLVEAAALQRAREECAADAAKRDAQRARAAVRREKQDAAYIQEFAAAVRRQFPGCPPGQEQVIARHACEKYSDRVGRTAAAKELDSQTVRLAVIAHIRHTYTEYDALRNRRLGRDVARDQIRGQVNGILRAWEQPAESSPTPMANTLTPTTAAGARVVRQSARSGSGLRSGARDG